MNGRLRLTNEHTLVALAALALGIVACLSPVHNDTWWHLAYGREMAAAGGFAQVDHFSHTAPGQPFPNHQWLAERVFYSLHAAGGLPLLTGACAAVLVAGWALCWRLSRGTLLDRLAIMAGAVASSTLVWSIRPQVFTIALLPLTVTLLHRRRPLWLPAVALVWANLHGGVLLGLIAIAVWTVVAFLSREAMRWRLAAVLAASIVATLATPLNLSYWPEILASLRRSQVHRLHEWQPPPWPPDQLLFWIAGAALAVLAATRWRSIPELEDRSLIATALVLLAPATRTLRNIAPYMMVAAPALTALIARAAPPQESRPSRLGSVPVAAGAVCAVAIVGWAWVTPWQRLGWQPVSPDAAAAIRDCPGPIYNTYADGGPIIWFVPGQPVFVDSRQDHYPTGHVQLAADIENGARDPEPVFARFGIRCAAVPPLSPVASVLVSQGWLERYRDSQWVVLTPR